MKTKFDQKELERMVSYAVKHRASSDFCDEAMRQLEQAYTSFLKIEEKNCKVRKNKELLLEYLEYCIDHIDELPEFQSAVEILADNGKMFRQSYEEKEKFAPLAGVVSDIDQ